MACASCGNSMGPTAKFCDACGCPTQAGKPGTSEQSVVVLGERNHTKIGKFAPKTVTKIKNFGEHPIAPTPPTHSEKWSWKSPLTQARLTWAGLVLGLLSLVEGYQGMQPFFAGLLGGRASFEPSQSMWLLGLGFTLAPLMLVLIARDIVRKRTQHFTRWSLLPVIKEADGRLALARYTGTCTICGGKLRFYDKPIEWSDQVVNGRAVRKVTARTMAAECNRNDDHWWRVDPAESTFP